MSQHPTLLGDFSWTGPEHPLLKEKMRIFSSPSFIQASPQKRLLSLHQALFSFLVETPAPAFLLPAVIQFIDTINQSKWLPEPYHISSFEFWFNQFSGCSEEENREIRGKIVGKWLPREAYQNLFPIGMGKFFFGTHFVAAHLAPDVDSMVASFWGWVDAFATRIGTGLHRWSLPGGAPKTPFTQIFQEFFGNGAIDALARTDSALTLTAQDLLTQEGIKEVDVSTFTPNLEHRRGKEAILCIDPQGHFLGEWRRDDLERVRPVIIAFKSLLHWFDNALTEKLVSLFSQDTLHEKEITHLISSLFAKTLHSCTPISEFSTKQTDALHSFFQKILHIPKGLQGTFSDFWQALAPFSLPEIASFEKEIRQLPSSPLFDKEGRLIENRPRIFQYLKKVIERLEQVSQHIRNVIERLDIMIQIKQEILHAPSPTLTLNSDVEEIRLKIENLEYLLVLTQEEKEPIGIVRSDDLRKEMLGTVSFRDFCNQEEVKMASYLQVISVMDHHKTSLQTQATPTARISDAQSCNVLLAEEAFALNDPFSTGGIDRKHIQEQLSSGIKDSSAQTVRLFSRYLQRKKAADTQTSFYVHPQREFVEYSCFLYAILDDTDLLTKVSDRDVQCVMQLVNRMKSLSVGEEVEIIHDDAILRNDTYARKLAQRILKNEDMYSIYKNIYAHKEREVEEQFRLCQQGDFSTLFADTKEQNGFARIGQTKIFSSNVPAFQYAAASLRIHWIDESETRYRARPEIDLYLHMISTIPSAQEVYEEKTHTPQHQDELWFWIPPSQQAFYHLIGFLSSFQFAPELLSNAPSLQVLGPAAKELVQAFERNFLPVPIEIQESWEKEASMAILRFSAGSLNSRKAMVSPYLPRIVP